MPPPLSLPPPSLLLISLGNPGPRYTLTRHNAGHILLTSLATSLNAPPFLPSPLGNPSSRTGPGLSTSVTVSLPAAKKPRRPPTTPLSFAEEYQSPPTPPEARWTLYQCPSLMNVSGKEVALAWRRFLSDAPGENKKLVILHDSLEDGLGRLRVQRNGGGVSARGHNGIKSILETFKSVEGRERRGKGKAGDAEEAGRADKDWIRLNVGVGRPESRHPDQVAAYVLENFRQGELDVLRGRTTREVLELLKGLK